MAGFSPTRSDASERSTHRQWFRAPRDRPSRVFGNFKSGAIMPWLLIALCLFPQAEGSSPLRLYPVDDSLRDASFRSFVKKLRSAVEARNPSALRKLVDNEVVVGSVGEPAGWAQFSAKWRPDDAD